LRETTFPGKTSAPIGRTEQSEASFTSISKLVKRAGVASIGYTNHSGKRDLMTELKVGAVISSMADLALSLRANATPFDSQQAPPLAKTIFDPDSAESHAHCQRPSSR
jgi:hypothetical protein